MITCLVCDDVIVKYSLDLGDTVTLKDKNNNSIYLCEDCSYKVAEQRIRR